MDDAGSLRRLRADGDGPRLRFLLARREVGLQAKQVIRLARKASQAAFLQAKLLEEHLGFFLVKLGQVGLDLGADGHGRAAVDLGEVGVHLVFVDVGHVQDRFHGKQVQIVQGIQLVLRKAERANAMALVQAVVCLFSGLELCCGNLVATGVLLEAGQRLLNGAHVGKNQLGLDGLDVAGGVHATINMHDVGVVEVADDLADGVGLADVGQKLVAQAFTLRCTGNQAGNVDELDRGGHDLLRVIDLRKLVKTLVGNGNDAHIGLDGGERVVRGKGVVVRQRVEQGGLTDVRKADDAYRKGHDAPLRCFTRIQSRPILPLHAGGT